jgi:hypothetical protein
MTKFQNDFMHAGDVFEKGKQLAKFFQAEIKGDPNLDMVCENFKNAMDRAGGYSVFVAIRSVDGERCTEPRAYIMEGVQTISMEQNGSLGWGLFKDMLETLGYTVETNEHMVVEKVSYLPVTIVTE